MVVREWGEIRKLYKSCAPKSPFGNLVTWLIKAFAVFLILIVLLFMITIFSLNSLNVFGVATPYLQAAFMSLAFLVIAAIEFLGEKARATEYKALYIAHGLNHYPWLQRRLYLHYALFLRAVMDRTAPVSRETITRLRSFADIAGPPPLPESRLLQPAFIVPYIVLLNTLILEILKRADLLEGRKGIAILIFSLVVLLLFYYLLNMLQLMVSVRLSTDRLLLRFLQWAEYDLEDVQRLKTQSLRMDLPDSSES